MVEAVEEENELPNERWIGIDLGTTNTCVAYWQKSEDAKIEGKGEVVVI